MWSRLSSPGFPPEIEKQFQESYYSRVRPTLRLVTGVIAATLVVYLLLGTQQTAPFVGVFSTPYLTFCVVMFGLTYAPGFGRVWQQATVGLAWLASFVMLLWLGWSLHGARPLGDDARTFGVITHLFFLLETCVLMVGVAALRLHFRATLILQSSIVLTGLGIVIFILPPDMDSWHSAVRFIEPVFLILLGVLLASLIQERLARGAYETNRQLALLQQQERQKRIESEKMLHILNGAIGGIVHDLGNPLTAVQNGSEMLARMAHDEDSDPETVLELNDIVLRGAKMLNFLRLSLIEQSRVLEGRPVPVDLKPVSIREIVEAGTSFQKPRFAHGHQLTMEEQDFQICADEMKMVTVLMNLIGNALKYSDGHVHVGWRAEGELLLLVVMDEGKAGHGLSQSQAAELFVPFGRLATHANIEGTGLGLLSVQKIVEAHGGAIWIEGFQNGAHESTLYSTAKASQQPSLAAPFRTAFALTCPLA